MQWAAYEGHQTVVQALIAAGADVNKQNNNGWIPLHWATYNGRQAIVQDLIAAGADVNQPNNKGRIPLHMAAYYGHQAVVQALIAAGADVNQPDNNGKTPLQKAARLGHPEIVNLINRVNASPDIAKKQVLALLSAMHPRLGAESPVSLIMENQRNGLFHIIGQWIRQAALEYAVYQS